MDLAQAQAWLASRRDGVLSREVSNYASSKMHLKGLIREIRIREQGQRLDKLPSSISHWTCLGTSCRLAKGSQLSGDALPRVW
jgi:hypothetical protein